MPIRPNLELKGIGFVAKAVEAIDAKAKRLKLDGGETLDYDYLVITTGPKLSFDEVPGAGPHGGHTHSVCTVPHAQKFWADYQEFLKNPGPMVIGAMPGASCFGPAYEFAFIVDSDLRKRKLRHKVPITFVTSEPYIGHMELGGVGDSKSMLESELHGHDIKWICNAKTAGQPAIARGTWNAICLADMGHTGAVFVALPQIPPRNVNWFKKGKWVHVAKIAFEKYFMRKMKSGNSEPIYEKYVLKAMGSNGSASDLALQAGAKPHGLHATTQVPKMTAVAQAAASGMRLPVRAALHWMLLRGLRAPRMQHGPSWTDGALRARGITAFQVRGAREQHLAAWVALPQSACSAQPVPVVVAVHGWGANGSTLAPMVEPLVHAGIAVVLFDAASHGESSTEAFSSLPRFAEDLAAVLDELREMPAIDVKRVGLLGHSVGAAAVLLHTARQGGVRAVVSLSAFAHPREVMERWLQEHHIPRRWIGAAILEHVQEVIGERFDCIAPLHQLSSIECPVLLVHGEYDQTVPLSDAHRLQALVRRGELLVVEGDHDLRASLAPHACQLVQFFSIHLEAIAIPCSSD